MMKRFVLETLRNYGPPLQWPFLSLEALIGVLRNLHDPVFHGRNIRYGDGKPLLLVPGHLAGDATLLPLAMWLRAIGYRPTQLGVPINWDDRLLDNSLAAALPDAARGIGRKAVIVAFGTGVRTALRVAALDQDHVSDVIALGLPDQLPPIPKGVRLHAVGRTSSQSNTQGELRIVEGSETLLHITQTRSGLSPRFFDRYQSHCSKAAKTKSPVDPGRGLRAETPRQARHDRALRP
jgi:hypothetical protein